MSESLQTLERAVQSIPAFELKVEVPARNVSDLLIAAFETPAGEWIDQAKHLVPRDHELRGTPYAHAYAALIPGGRSVVKLWENGQEVSLTRDKVLLGLAKFVKHPRCTAELFDPDGCGLDAVAADVFLQLCLFGEVRYG